MTEPAEDLSSPKSQRSKGLLVTISVIGVLYFLLFVVDSRDYRPEYSYELWEREQIFVRLMFMFFLVGYVAAWINEGIAGVIFILWWIAMWGVEWFVFHPANPGQTGIGIVGGIPLLVLGILYVRRWYKGRRTQAVLPP
jgi:hypothetical protein